MEKNNIGLIVLIILIITLFIYYHTNNMDAQPIYIKALGIFTILYSSLYLCFLSVPDLIDNRKMIYGGEDLNSMKFDTDIPDVGRAYYSNIGLIIIDKNRNFAFLKKDNKLGFPKHHVDNTINTFDKIKAFYKDFTGSDFNDRSVASIKTQIVLRTDKNDVQYYIFVLKTELKESDKLALKDRQFIVNQVYNVENTGNMMNADSYNDLKDLLNQVI